MTQPENYTAAQASDPQTSGQTLADIAAQRPDLRPAVAANPSTYPALLDWLKSLGEPAVDAALASRAQATQVLPAQPFGQATPPAPSWAGGAPAVPAAAPAAAPAYAAAPGYGAPQGMPPQGMPPGGMPPGGFTPGYAGTPAKKSNKALWIVLIIIGVVLLLGGLVVFLIIRAAQDTVENINDDVTDIVDDVTDDIDDAMDDPMNFGDDPQLDALYTACGEGDWQACDDLYDSAPIDSEYFEFADTCGGQWEAGTTTYCVEAMAEGGDDGGDVATGPAGDGAAEQAYFAALTEACAAQEWAACDELYWQSPSGSTEEAFGRSCGGASEDGYGDCSSLLGGAPYAEPMARGASRFLDALWDACAAGDAEACDALWDNSPIDSEYETFAESQR